jgi:hypothetical protein
MVEAAPLMAAVPMEVGTKLYLKGISMATFIRLNNARSNGERKAALVPVDNISGAQEGDDGLMIISLKTEEKVESGETMDEICRMIKSPDIIGE